MLQKLLNPSVTFATRFIFTTFVLLTTVIAQAGDCDSLFTPDFPKFTGPVSIRFASGKGVPFELQHELIRLSEADEFRVAADILRKMRKGARNIFLFAGKSHTAELSVFHSSRGTWFIGSASKSLLSGRGQRLAGDVTVGAEALPERLDIHLAMHMRAIRNLFLIEYAVERNDFIRPILDWVKASGESPFKGNLVKLFVASRNESFHLDRGFDKASTTLEDTDLRKMAAIEFLVKRRLTFALGTGQLLPGIYTQVGQERWARVSSSDDRSTKDPTLLLFQAMANAGFVFENGVYRVLHER